MEAELRRKNLAALVGRRYFQYQLTEKRREVADILENLLRKADDEAVRLTADVIIVEAVKVALRALGDAVRRAIKERLVYREFGVVYDRDLLGALDVARSTAVKGQSLIASLTYLPALNAPEYFLLRKLASKSLKLAKSISGEDSEVMHLINKVSKAVKRLPRGYTTLSCDDVEYISWLRIACTVSRFLGTLKRRGARVGRSGKGEKSVVFIDWKLYEIYIYYLLYELLESLGFRRLRCPLDGGPDLCLSDGRQRIEVYFNKPAPCSIVSKYDGVPADKVRGRPDAYIRSDVVRIVIEAKFSTDPSYITAGRFKTMAYVYEYGADAGVLIFPSIEGKGLDEEEKSTAELYQYMERYGGMVTIHLRDGRAIYLIRIDPAEREVPVESDEIARNRLRRALEQIIRDKTSATTRRGA